MSRTRLRAAPPAMSFSVRPSFLPGRRVVLRHDGREPGGREVGAGVDELEVAELGAAEVGPALAGGREPAARRRSRASSSGSRARAPSAPTSRSRAACARSRAPPRPCSGWSASKLSSRPHSEEAGDHATGLKVPLAIRASASPEEALMPSTKTVRPSTSLAPGVERLDQRDEQLLLLRRVGEGDLDRVRRRRARRCPTFACRPSRPCRRRLPANHATAPTASAANSASRSWPRFMRCNLTASG